jgi:sugar lactone lactonase YvrE
MRKLSQTLALGVGAGVLMAAAPVNEIVIPAAKVAPESITVTAGGDLIAGSNYDGTVWRAKRGQGRAHVWLDPAKTGMKSLLGVFADDARNRLFVCSRPSRFGEAPPADGKGSDAHIFDLRSGAVIATYPMPDGIKDVCNDFAVARDGTAYIAETAKGAIYRIKPGATAIDVWLTDSQLAGADGIAFDTDGKLYVTSVTTARAFRVGIAPDGSAAGLTELSPSRPLRRPDGLRNIGAGRFLIAENSPEGGIALATLTGDRLEIRTLAGGRPGTTSAVLRDGRAWGVVANPAEKQAANGQSTTIYSVSIE